MVTTTLTPERQRYDLQAVRILADQIRFDLPLAKDELQNTWQKLERRLPHPTTVGAAPANTPIEPHAPLIEELRRFRNRVRHDAGAHRTQTAPST
jgi:hypothetical protein